MTHEASGKLLELADIAPSMIQKLERVYDALTPGAIERADLDGMAFDIADVISMIRARAHTLSGDQ